LQELGKEVNGFVVKQEAHAWDKKPRFLLQDQKREDMYSDAVKHIKKMVAV